MKFLKLVLFIAFFAVIAIGASFDCRKASTYTEKTICRNPVLSELDEELADSYQNAKVASDDPSALKREQIYWLKNVRDTCNDAKCIQKAYEMRIDQLDKIYWDGVSGVYVKNDDRIHGSLLIQRDSPDIILFEIDLCQNMAASGPGAPDVGHIDGNATISGGKAIFFDEDTDCKIVFRFSQNQVEVEAEDCSYYMGHRVYASGEYRIIDKTRPNIDLE